MIDLGQLRVGNTVCRVESGKREELTLDALSVIQMFCCDKPTGCPYDYLEVDREFLESRFDLIDKEDNIWGEPENNFYIIDTKEGWRFTDSIVDMRLIGNPLHYCHQVENLYQDLTQ